MTEFVVTAAFVMVPLFLIIPAMAKFVDMKLASVQSARYVTWEFTSHYIDLDDQPEGFKEFHHTDLPQKSMQDVIGEAKRRLYSDSKTLIVTGDNRYKHSDRNPLWTYHNGLAMYVPAGSTGTSGSGSDPTPDHLRVASGVFGAMGAGLNIMADILGFLGVDAGFDAMNPDGNLTLDGKYTANMKMKLNTTAEPTHAGLDGKRASLFKPRDDTSPFDLTFTSKSALVTENWGAGGKRHAVYQSSGLVPTVIIDHILNGWGIPLQTIASTVLLSPELGADSLKFGYPVNDPEVMDEVPVGKLESDENGDRELICEDDQGAGRYCIY